MSSEQPVTSPQGGLGLGLWTPTWESRGSRLLTSVVAMFTSPWPLVYRARRQGSDLENGAGTGTASPWNSHPCLGDPPDLVSRAPPPLPAPPTCHLSRWVCCLSPVSREVAAERHGAHLEPPCGWVTGELTAHLGGSSGPGPGRAPSRTGLEDETPGLGPLGAELDTHLHPLGNPPGRPRVSEPRGGVLAAQRSGKASQLLGHSSVDRRQWGQRPPVGEHRGHGAAPAHPAAWAGGVHPPAQGLQMVVPTLRTRT